MKEVSNLISTHWAIVVAVPVDLLLLRMPITSASIADSSIPDSEVTSSQAEADTSASNTIKIAMYALPDERAA